MRREHATYSDFLAFAERSPLVGEHGCNSSRDTTDPKWAGTATFADAMTLARNGWEAGRAEIEKHRSAFSAIIGSKIRRAVLSHDMAGFAPDVGAFLQGDPECMFAREFSDSEAPGRILNVVVNGAVSSGISAAQIMRRGALICALVDALESAGYSCQLTASFSARDGGQLAEDLVPVKQAGEPLELDRVAFIFAHPSMLRRMVFSAWEQDTPFMLQASYGYGTPNDVPEADRGDLYFGRVFLGDVSDRDVVPWFKAQLRPLGITFDE